MDHRTSTRESRSAGSLRSSSEWYFAVAFCLAAVLPVSVHAQASATLSAGAISAYDESGFSGRLVLEAIEIDAGSLNLMIGAELWAGRSGLVGSSKAYREMIGFGPVVTASFGSPTNRILPFARASVLVIDSDVENDLSLTAPDLPSASVATGDRSGWAAGGEVGVRAMLSSSLHLEASVGALWPNLYSGSDRAIGRLQIGFGLQL